jgi:hypothetical protein
VDETIHAVRAAREGGVVYSAAFFDLQFQFASRVASVSDLTLEQALLDYTNLYVRFGFGRGFDRDHPGWCEYLAGLRRAADPCAWTYRFFVERAPDVAPPAVVASFGCFSYADSGDAGIRLHFQNRDALDHSPLAKDRMPARLGELRALFRHAGQTRPAASRVAGTSWLYNLSAYRRLFPPSYLASASVADARFRNLPLWGQFLDRHGAVRPGMSAPFLERLSRLAGLDGLAGCFPFQALALEAPLADFQRFYEI